MKRDAKAGMTAVLSMMLLMVLTLILGLLESARMQSARAQMLANADIGMFSFLGGYDRDLLERYDVFFMDGGLGTAVFQTEELNRRLGYYCGVSEKDADSIQKSSWTGLKMQKTGFSAVMLAADQGGAPFFHQAVLYAKENLMLSLLDTGETVNTGMCLQQGEELLEKADEVSDQIEEIRERAKEQIKEEHKRRVQKAEENGEVYTEEPDFSNLEFENPIHTFKQLLKTGITGLAGNHVSEVCISEAERMSQRTRNSGWGVFEVCSEMKVSEGMLFNEYILDKLPCLTTAENALESVLNYPCEYVLAGKGSDQENLKNVLNKLLAIRFGLNLSSLMASTECNGQAEALAAVISAAAALPLLEPVMKTAVLMLWALEESLIDVYTLCSGGKVEYMKQTGDFTCTIERLFSFQIKEGKTSETGTDYQGYIRWMLALVPLETRVYRCMDMVEHRIRRECDRPGFCMDTALFAAKAEVTASVRALFLPSMWNGGKLHTVVTGSYYMNE